MVVASAPGGAVTGDIAVADQRVVALLSLNEVVCAADRVEVGVVVADLEVGAELALEIVPADASGRVAGEVGVVADDEVVVEAALDVVVAGAADQDVRVVALQAVARVVAADDAVVPGAAADDVAAAVADERVIAA